MKLNWNFLGGQGVQNKIPSVGGVWTGYFLELNKIFRKSLIMLSNVTPLVFCDLNIKFQIIF